MTNKLVDLGSDTATLPSEAMLAFMLGSRLGDDQKQEDPTVNALEDAVSSLLGKEAALFLPSATMANEIAVKVHTQPGDEVILDRESHFVTSEAGGPAFLSGVSLHPVAGRRGIFTAAQVAAGIRRKVMHCPRTRLVSVEQTTNRGGGAVWSLEELRAVAEIAETNGLRTHMDGSRLMNAVVASQIAAARHTQGFDSVTFCLSKGLGCPIGALLAGDRAFIAEARRYKHIFGGAMRQAGIVAGAGVYALQHNVERLAEDHDNAKLLARLLAQVPGVRIAVEDVVTNILFFDVGAVGISGTELVDRLFARGVRMGAWGGETQVRAVTHLDIARADIEKAAAAVADVLAEFRKERAA
jgi:threonine aldolase